MSLRRLSTRTFGLRAAAYLENSAKLLEALHRPMIVDILLTMDAHDAARFFVLGPVQTFKSLVGQLRLLRNHLVRARPALWYSPTEDFGKDFADLKLNPLIEVIPDLQLLHHDTGTRGQLDRTRSGKLSRRLTGGATHLILSANTERDRHGKTACDLYRDETHDFEPGAVPQIANRRKDYPDEFTETDMTTGLHAGTDAHGLWNDTDNRTWHCRCPHCNKLFEPRYTHYSDDPGYGDPVRPASDNSPATTPAPQPDAPASDPVPAGTTRRIVGGLRYTRAWRADGLPDETAIAATLRYECPRCHGTLPDTDGSRLALSGTADRPRGIYVMMNASPSARCFGWTYHGIALRPWLPIVIRFEKAQLARARGDLEELGKFIREECAGIWRPHDHLGEQKLRPTGGYLMLQPIAA